MGKLGTKILKTSLFSLLAIPVLALTIVAWRNYDVKNSDAAGCVYCTTGTHYCSGNTAYWCASGCLKSTTCSYGCYNGNPLTCYKCPQNMVGKSECTSDKRATRSCNVTGTSYNVTTINWMYYQCCTQSPHKYCNTSTAGCTGPGSCY